MNDASMFRMSLWLVVALVVAIALLVAAAFVIVQPIVGHALGDLWQGPGQMARECGGVPVPC